MKNKLIDNSNEQLSMQNVIERMGGDKWVGIQTLWTDEG